jgi:hypothetical protein
MKSLLLTLAATSALLLGGAFNSTADAQIRGYRAYYGPRQYTYRYYAPRSYRATYRTYGYYSYPYYSPYRYGPYYGRSYYRPYYGGYYSPGVGISVGPFRAGVRF